jgi:hypothetical protein
MMDLDILRAQQRIAGELLKAVLDKIQQGKGYLVDTGTFEYEVLPSRIEMFLVTFLDTASYLMKKSYEDFKKNESIIPFKSIDKVPKRKAEDIHVSDYVEWLREIDELIGEEEEDNEWFIEYFGKMYSLWYVFKDVLKPTDDEYKECKENAEL